ncbi:secreted RxLR effector protein 161-like [Gossypium hirsutum]|uniref:Secreted RxLR effector protein 161-like n=1 Tax=Gossypium hirsutum TaxID=3635 RepID=A0A1U8NJD9_GOSHI|nr:secreted RxLR effector protein 161-like [Gossypium hirsutum]
MKVGDEKGNDRQVQRGDERAIRLDIMHAVSLLSRYMNCASEIHFQAAKRILRYVKRTVDYGIKFSHVENFNLHGYFDSDWARCADDMHNTSGYSFSLVFGIFSWCSKKQQIVAQSTAEAEYVVATTTENQALWIRKLFDRFAYGARGKHTDICGQPNCNINS